MPREISSRTSLDTLKREARRWLKALQAQAADARERLTRAWPDAPAAPTLRDVQHALAREHGLSGWTALKARVGRTDALRRYERVAEALVAAYATGDEAAVRTVWEFFGHRRTLDGMRRYIRLDLGRPETPADPAADVVTLADAQYLVARSQGFERWEELAQAASQIVRADAFAAKGVAVFVAADETTKEAALRSRDWDEVFGVLESRRLPGLHANGQMTDDLLARVSRLDHITALDLSASPQLTDGGLRNLARLPHLQHLNLSGCRISDRGLEVLQHLPALETIGLAWTATSDTGASHLRACRRLRRVDLSGTPSGDGEIRALAGAADLYDFRSGEGVTDAGLPALQDLPVFRTWRGGVAQMALLSPDARPNLLMLRGPFTDAGMRALAALEGLFALNVDSSRLAVTGEGLVPLADLPHLEWLAFDAKDDSMAAIAALPHLRFLMCQDTSAGDEGFVALGRSRTIEHIWGRRCHNLRRRGFLALSEMPALRCLSVSCLNVDDEGLAALPRFPALAELMPMDVPDAGYRHIAGCPRIESLVLMYCRETTDAATEHLAALPALRKYFASYTRVTDRTPQILSGIASLEEVTFDGCAGLTTAGIAALARLPGLQRVSAESMPLVTRDVLAAFPPHVRVRWSA